MVHLQGLEPWTHWLRVSCSTNWAKGTFIVHKEWSCVWQGWQDLNLRMTESKSVALPLGDTPIYLLWGGWWESNPRPQGPQSCALTNWATPAILVRLKGFEPLTLGLEGRCSIQLSYRCICLRPKGIWSGWWESDPRCQLGRLEFYHWITPACCRKDNANWL